MKKILLVPIIIIVLVITVFILASTPFFLNFAKDKIETTIQSAIGNDIPVSIGSLKGNLFYTLEAREVNVDDIIKIKRLEISYDILKLVSKELDMNTIAVDGLHVNTNKFEILTKIFSQKERKPGEKKDSEFSVRIKKLSIMNSELFGVLNNQHFSATVDIKGRLDSDLFFIEYLNIATDQSNFLIQGYVPIRRDKNFDLQYNLNLLVDELNFQGLKGRVIGQGEIQGSAASPRILNKTKFDINYQENKLSGLLDIDWPTPTFDNLNLGAKIKIISSTKKSERKDEWDVSIVAKDKKFLCDFSSSYGYAKLDGILKGHLNNPQFDAKLTGLFKYEKFQSNITGQILYKDKRVDLNNIKITSDELSVKLAALINVEEPSIVKSDILISCDNLGILNNFLPHPQAIGGKLKVSAKIEGLFDNPYVRSTMKFNDVNIYSEKISSADFLIKLKNHIANLDSGVIRNTHGLLNLTGNYNLKNNEIATHLHSDQLILKSPEFFGADTIPINGNLALDIKLHGNVLNPLGSGVVYFNNFVYDTIALGDYQLHFDFKDSIINFSFLDDKKTLDLNAQLALYESLPFKIVLNLNHFDLANYTQAEQGYITARVMAHGAARVPEKISGKIEVDSLYLSFQHKDIQSIDNIIIDIDKGIADISSCAILIQNQRLQLQGRIPFDYEKNDINLSIKSTKIEVSDILLLLPVVPQIKGIFYVDINIKGNLKTPKIDGQLNLENMSYALPNMNFDSVYSLIKFKNSFINIEYLKGRINKGIFDIAGFANLFNGTIDTMYVDLSFNNIDLKLKDIGSFVLNSTMSASAKRDSFKIDGELTIAKGVYDAPFDLQTIIKLLTTANRPPPQQDKILRQIFCNVGISAPNGIKIANNLANAEVDLDLQLKGYLSKLNAYGTIATSQKGTIQYLGKRFEIAKAVIQFDNPYKIDPVLDLEASYFVSSSDVEYEIVMNLSGTIEDWRLELTSNPLVPEYDIVSLLLIGKRRPSTQILSNFAGVDIENTAKDYALSLMRGTIERKAEQTLGLEKFTITGDLLDPRQLDIGIEKRIARQFTLVYGTGIESWEMQRIGLNYDVTDNFSVYTLHDQENMNSSIDLDFHFKLK